MDREVFVERFLDKLEKHSKGETSDAVELADIIKNSIEKDGEVTKAVIAIEELSELQKELTKSIRGETDEVGILEEMADVYICLMALQTIFGFDGDTLDTAIEVKLLRLKNNLENGGED